jgi:hypothetical protein
MVILEGHEITGAVLSVNVITCVKGANIVFPQSSVIVHVLVNVPLCGHDPDTKEPAVFTGARTRSQLSLATGTIACAAVIPAELLHSRVTSSAPATVVHNGFVLSTRVITCV